MATEVKVPDIGDFKDVPIVEVHVKEGDAVNAEDPLVTLESDKASMEVPAPSAGKVEKVLVRVGDKVSEGSLILVLGGGEGTFSQPPSLLAQQEPALTAPPPSATIPLDTPAELNRPAAPDFSKVHAGPAVRRIARELGVDLVKVKGTGEKGRVTKEDVATFLKGSALPPAAGPSGGIGIPEIPAQDFQNSARLK